jgi:hypothetical protein
MKMILREVDLPMRRVFRIAQGQTAVQTNLRGTPDGPFSGFVKGRPGLLRDDSAGPCATLSKPSAPKLNPQSGLGPGIPGIRCSLLGGNRLLNARWTRPLMTYGEKSWASLFTNCSA